MANLPRDRITPSKPPFTYMEVDSLGHFEVKQGRSRVKRYGWLFMEDAERSKFPTRGLTEKGKQAESS